MANNEQTPDQIRGERDLLLLSVAALKYKLAKVKRVSKSRLARLNKVVQ